MEIENPRDRNSSFEPKIVAKRQTSVGNFGKAVISLYTRGMTTREIEQHVKDIDGVEDLTANFCPALPKNSSIRLWNGRADP